jgi:hypothetical protein
MTSQSQSVHVAKVAMHAVAELVGCPAEGVTSVRGGGDENWVIGVEVLEVERVPETSDVLASYHVEVDTNGEIVGFERMRRYERAQTEGV